MPIHTREDYLTFSGRIEDHRVSCAAFHIVNGETHQITHLPTVNIDMAEMKAARTYLLSCMRNDPVYFRHQIGQLDLAIKAMRILNASRVGPLMRKLGLPLAVLGL